MEKIKVHDWFASRFLNPDKDPMALISEGITPDTAEIKDRDFYKSKEKVKEAFKTDSGGFDEDKYNKVYDQFIAEYNYLSSVDSENFILNAYEKSSSNFSTDFGKIVDQEISVDKVANPLDLNKGITAINEWSTPTLSKREAAQKNQYWDNDLQKWSKNTVNEDGLLGILSGKPLVYATWDDDGEHVDKMTGKTVKHQKGEWKTDEFGDYYAETVNNEEALGKQFVTWSEVVSDDESPWNSIDIFDSDNLSQNIPRTILKAGVMAAATMLNPYVAGTVFYTTSAINLARVLPQISKSVSAFLGTEEFDKLNTWDNYMRRFGHSTSDYAQEHFFSFENIIDLAIDSYMQYGTQKAIAKIPERIGIGKEANKAMEQASRMSAWKLYFDGANLSDDMIRAVTKSTQAYRNAEKLLNESSKISSAISRAYLVATSVEDVYNQSKLYGFDSQTAGVISLAAYAGVGALFSTDYGRGLLYNADDYELAKDIKILTRKYLQNNAAKISNDVSNAGIDKAAKKSVLKKWGEKISKLFTDHLTDIKSGRFSIVQGGLAEGFEEVAEEISQDTAYQIGKAWQSVKELFTGKEYNNQYNYLDTDPLSRYGSSFFGGALGGAIFKMSDRFLDPSGKTAYDNWRKMMGGDNSEIMKQLVLYTSQGKKDIILDEIKKLKKTPLASTSISAFTGEAVKNEAESQNAVLFGMFEKAINDIDSFLNNYNLKIDKDSFGDIELIKGVRASWLVSQPNGGKGLQDSLFEDYQARISEIVSYQGQISDKRASIKDNTSEEEKSKITKEIDSIQKIIDFKLDQIRKLVKGEDDSYLGRLMLETSKKDILDKMIQTSKDGWAENIYGTNYDSLPELYQKDIDARMTKYSESGELQINYLSAWNLYKSITSADDVKVAFANSNEYSSLGLDQLITEEEKQKHDIIAMIAGNLFPELRQFQLSQMALFLLGKNVKFDTNIINARSFTSLGTKIENILSDETNKDLQVFLDNNPKAEEEIQAENIPDGITDEQYFRYLINQNNIDLSEIVSNWGSFSVVDDSYPLEEFAINVESIDKIINSINSKVSKLEIFSIITALLSRKDTDRDKFLLDDNEISTIEEVLSNLDLIDAIITGSDQSYSSRLVGGVPFGANNFLNQAWKDKGLSINLGTIDPNSVLYIKDRIEELKNKYQSILAAHRENSASVISTQKRIGIKVRGLKIKAIKALFEDPNFNDTIFNPIREQLQIPDLDKDFEKLTDEQYVELDVEYRNFLNKFEDLLYEFYHRLDENNKNEFVKKLKRNLSTNDSEWYNDTDSINIEVLNKKRLNGPTIYSWLASCILGNNNAIYKEYKSFINNLDKYPFDSQEEVIIMACKFILTPHIDELIRFFNITEEEKSKKVFSIPNILKIICSGGTGKSNVIIPAILQIVKNLGKTKFFAVANTDLQLQTLKNASDDITSENSLLISNLLENINPSNKPESYKDSIIIIDECSNIGKEDLEKLNSFAKEYNVKILALGDTTQHGIGAIDQSVALFPPILDESFRSLNNIVSENNKKFTNILSGTNITDHVKKFSLSNNFTYYDKDGIFAGIKYEDSKDKSFIENVKSFLQTHDIPKDASLLLFTDDAITEHNLTEYPNITIASKIEDVQGIEWDYVFTNSNILQSKKSSDVEVERNHIKNLYTLFSRAKEGVLTFVQPTVHINGKENELKIEESKFAPVKFGYINNKELLSAYVEFKKQVFDKLKLGDSVSKSGDTSGVQPPTKVTINKDESVPVSVGFVLKDDFDKTIAKALNISQENYILLRNLLYLYLASNKTDNSIKNKIDSILSNSNINKAEFLISIEHRSANELLIADNNGTLGDYAYPWLVYHVELQSGRTFNIHLGMFPDPKNDNNTLNKTSAFNTHLIELCNNRELGLYEIPKDVVFSRSTNALDFRRNSNDSVDVKVEYTNGESRVLIPNPTDGTAFNTLGSITSSLPCFFRQYSGSENIPVDSILDTIKEIEQLYQSLFKKLTNSGLPDADLALLTDIISYKTTADADGNQKITFSARQMPKLLDRFVVFASSKIDATKQTPYNKLMNLSKQYLVELKELKLFLQDIDTSFKKVTSANLIDLQTKLQTKILFSVSPIVFSPETVNKDEVETYIDSVCNDLNSKEVIIGGQKVYRAAYHRAIGEQFALLTQRLAYLSTLTDNEVNEWNTANNGLLTKSELQSLLKLWETHENAIIKAYKEHVNDEGDPILGLQLLLDNSKNNKQSSIFPELFKSDEFKTFLKNFYKNYSTLAGKLNKLSSKYANSPAKNNRVVGKLVWNGYLHNNLIKDNGIIIDFDSTAVEVNGNHSFTLNGIVLQQSKLQIYSSSNIDTKSITKYQPNNAIQDESGQEESVQEEVMWKEKLVFNQLNLLSNDQNKKSEAWALLQNITEFWDKITKNISDEVVVGLIKAYLPRGFFETNIMERVKSVLRNIRPALYIDVINELTNNKEFIKVAQLTNNDEDLLNVIKTHLSVRLRNEIWLPTEQSNQSELEIKENMITLAEWLDDHNYSDYIQDEHHTIMVNKSATKNDILQILENDEDLNENLIGELERICK